MSMRRLNLKAHHFFGFKYLKLSLLALFVFLAYFIFSWYDPVTPIIERGFSLPLLVFIAGVLFSFGFTAPFAVGLFLTLPITHIITASLIAGVGSLVGDLFIFLFIKMSLMDEFIELEHTTPFRAIRHLIRSKFSAHVRNYFLYIFAGIIIASPLPDEIGVTMLAGLTSLHKVKFALLSFILHSAAIYLLLAASVFF